MRESMITGSQDSTQTKQRMEIIKTETMDNIHIYLLQDTSILA
jgi:hypothetical protein